MPMDEEQANQGRIPPEPWRPEPAPVIPDPYNEDPYYPDPYARL